MAHSAVLDSLFAFEQKPILKINCYIQQQQQHHQPNAFFYRLYVIHNGDIQCSDGFYHLIENP
jgi:hypothetical protein